MTSQTTTKVRFVKCPTCRQILQEPTNTPLYQCGGCSTVLQAKNSRNNKSKDAGSHLQETDPAQKVELEHVSEDNVASSPSQKGTLSSTEESTLDNSNGRGQNELGNCIREHPGGINLSDQLSSTELTCHENKKSAPEAGAHKEVHEECYLDQSNRRDQNDFEDCNKEQPGSANLSNGISSSTELTSQENEVSSPEAGAHREVDGECYLDQNNGISSSTELTSHENEVPSPEAGANREADEECYSDQNNSISSSTELTSHENEVPSPEAGAYREVDEEFYLNQNNGIFSSTELTSHLKEVTSPEAGAHREVHEECYFEVPSPEAGAHREVDEEFFSDQNNGISSSTELKIHENEVSSPEAGAYREVDEEFYSDQNNGISSSTELTSHENEVTSPEAGAHREVDEECYLDQSNRISSSTELTSHEKEVASPEAGAHREVDEECYLDQNNRISSSTELTSHENVVSSPEAKELGEVDEECYLDQNNRRDQTLSGDCNREQPEDATFSSEVPSSAELNGHEIEDFSPTVGTHVKVDENMISCEVPPSTEFTCHEIEETSLIPGEDDNFKSRFIFRSSSLENLQTIRPEDSAVTAQRPLDESISSDNLKSSYNELLEQSHESDLHEYLRVRSIDTLENAPLVIPRSELSVTLRDMPKSPTTRSYYAYDGSVSSYDETDDQVPNWNLHPSKRKFRNADYVNQAGDELIVDDTRRSDLDMKHQSRNFLSFPSEKKHHAMRGSQWHRDELLEPTRYGHPVRSRERLETSERLSRLPFNSRDCQAGYERGSPSRYGHNEFQCKLSSHSPDKPEYSEQDKMTLLRMVYELQDQLNRTYISKGKAGKFPAGVVMKEKQIPSYYDHVTPEEICHDFNCPRYVGRCSQGKSWSQQCDYPQGRFSGEAAKRHQVDHSCLHCCPQERHFSAQLPLQSVCCGKGHYGARSRRTCYNLYHPRPSSPQQYTSSEFSSLSYDMKSDDHQWRKDHEVKKSRLRDRNHLLKRHFRPMAGGAPFIACYHCKELLRLPEDFLLFGRTCHRLKCSACSEVLKFSIQDRTHIVPYIPIVPYTPDSAAPPPSEVDDTIDTTDRTLASASHASDCPRADPISCSDDYGPSFGRSCSTEVEPFSLTPPFPVLERNYNDRKMSSGSSFEPMEERENRLVTRESRNKYKNPVETFESQRPSSSMYKPKKLSSEIEELPASTGSPLHRLMGYSSPSEVINK
ncbi:uncharacterized protein LOC132270696 [Cornus florida]|uniref:uncharacterized protein LOC132270696 n=1 Tax=Cornus florida TaxID=4283 RepID=UPI0028A2B870|nr:uncharacterized protein LOC132270696 [Cornus florida]XP_059627866.1 uncharacterized protein LOC132270696 [Cornus florida]XP_059627867.1 uncharacterized protein LOC132270696 [Cornus florida]